MSSTINASTASGGGVITTADASGILQLQTAGVTGLTIDASQNVGIGTSSPVDKLQIEGNIYLGTTGRTIYQGGSADLTLQVNTGVTKFLRANGVSESMRIDSSGNLLVGTTAASTSPTTGFTFNPQTIGAYAAIGHSTSAGSGSYFISFGYNGGVIGTITQNGTTGVLYNVSSDQRLKTNVQPAGSAIQSILDFPVDQFDWISDSSHQDFGGVAQKILKVIPEMVSVPENHEEMMGVDWSKAVPRLIKTIQELKAIIDTQNARIEALEAK